MDHARPPLSVTVDEEEEGLRLDVLLARRLGVGRAQTRRMLAAGDVELGARTLGLSDKSRVVAAGQTFEVAAHAAQQRIIAQADLEIPVLAQGEGWVVVDKPAGMAVHPLQAAQTSTVLNFVAARWPRAIGVGEGTLRSGVVHRLDVDTSGVLVVATTQPMWEFLRQAFASHTVRKIYRAIVAGRLEGERREEMDLVIAQHQPAKVRILAPGEAARGARRCDLRWKSLSVFDDATLLEIELGTGFLHQIRVMLANLGHPVLGDRVYGSPATAARAPRQMLHAARIAFGPIDATSPDPADFTQTLASLRT